MQRIFKLIVIGTVTLAIAGCSTIKPEPGSQKIKELSKSAVKSCERLGLANTSTVDKVAFYDRDQQAVNIELVTLAKNEAVRMGGNAIVMEGQPQFGNATFVVYRC